MFDAIATPLGYVMYFCYSIMHNYALAIVLFTIFTKFILFPVSLWVHKNGIKMVKMTPELNRIKIRYFGDKDRIADETQELYKKVKYNPFAGLIPLVLQIVLLMGLIQVIYNPLTHLLHLEKGTIQDITQLVSEQTGIDPESASLQIQTVSAIQKADLKQQFLSLSDVSPEVYDNIRGLDLVMAGLNLGEVPFTVGGKLLLIPLLAALAAYILCVSQNRMNPLQAQQGKGGQAVTSVTSVGISLVLGFFVPAGVGFYWIFSNLFTILQQAILNLVVPPKKAIDYAALAETERELQELESLGVKKKWYQSNPNARREREDYRRFFSVANKHVVFYSEGSGFYKYFQRLIKYLLSHSNLIIHYITSDPDDQIFRIADQEPRIRAYYIGEKKLITLMMKMDADIVIMTMPDLENYHIKRSYVKQDVEYIMMFHGCTSTHMVLRERALDHYDTHFCVGPYQVKEIRYTEEKYKLPAKNLIVTGYGLIEDLVESYEKMDKKNNDNPQILIAPSYQADNILDSCIDGLLNVLFDRGYHIIVRPHPQYIRRAPQKIEAFRKKYQKELEENVFEFQTDFSSSETVYQSDIVITDWSTISYEFSFTTLKPTLFINTPMKVINPHYTEYPMPPLDITLRSRIGQELELDRIDKAGEIVSDMLEHQDKYTQMIRDTRNDLMPEFGHSAEIGGHYILTQLMKKK